MMTDAAAVLGRNRRRRRARLWIAVGTLPLTLAALALVVKLLSMVVFAQVAVTAYAAGDPAGTAQAARGQDWANWFEPYKAHYNAGVGLAASGALGEARTEFERALDLAEGLDACAVRFNLALTIEWIGDAADSSGDAAGAATAYTEALETITGMPDECRTPEADEASPDPDRTLADDADESERRLREKLQPPPPTGGEGEGDQPGPSESDLDELQRQLQEGTQDRDALDDDGGGGGPEVDKPW